MMLSLVKRSLQKLGSLCSLRILAQICKRFRSVSHSPPACLPAWGRVDVTYSAFWCGAGGWSAWCTALTFVGARTVLIEMSDARLVITFARCSRYSPGYSREYSRATTSGSSERAPRNPAFPTGGGDGGWGGRVVEWWLWDWERRVLGHRGVLPAMASLVSWHLWHHLWHHLWQNASSRSGSTHAGRCDSSTLEYRTAELADETTPISATPCV